MVCEDLHREWRALEIVFPRFEGVDDSKKLLVIDVIIAFSRNE